MFVSVSVSVLVPVLISLYPSRLVFSIGRPSQMYGWLSEDAQAVVSPVRTIGDSHSEENTANLISSTGHYISYTGIPVSTIVKRRVRGAPGNQVPGSPG